jgi:hypothetical protein
MLQQGFIIPFWSAVFGFMEKVSVFHWISILLNKYKPLLNRYTFVETWVFGHLIASILASIIIYNVDFGPQIWHRAIIWLIIVYGALRVFEIIIYQINMLFFHPFRGENYHIKSARRTLILLLHNYAEIIFWYSAIQMGLLILAGQSLQQIWVEYIRLNFYCIATLDGSIISNYFGNVPRFIANLTFIEVISGLIITIISLARFISLLPPVKQLEE